MKGMKRVGFLTSGGDCQALNATMRGVAKGLYQIYDDDVEIIGFEDGYKGLMYANYRVMNRGDFSGILTKGGTMLGTSRQPFKLMRVPDENGLDKVELMKHTYYKLKLDALVVLGGNGSQKTANLLSQEGLNVIGLPKTIDNDLMEIDHCPGFASAAKYIATTFAELERDVAVYDSFGVTIVEIMGRNAGWLTAASSLSRVNGNRGPDFIYLCEVPFSISRFLDDIRSRQSENRNLLVAVSEGVRDENGTYLSEQTPGNSPDRFGHKDIAGTGGVLAQIVRNELGCKTRSLELNLMQRCAAHLASRTDLNESRLLGTKAVQCAVQGQTGKMATLLRLPSKDRYRIQFAAADVSLVANREKTVPRQWINRSGNDITREMTDYLTPLMEGEVPVLYRNRFPEYFTISPA